MAPTSTAAQSLSRRRALAYALALLVVYMILTAAVAAAQAVWRLPGLLLPAVEALLCLAVLLWAATLSRRHAPGAPATRGRGWHTPVSVSAGLLVLALVLVAQLAATGGDALTPSGRLTQGDLPPLARGDRWMANGLAYAWRPLQRGDVVSIGRRHPPEAAVVVGLPGQVPVCRSERLVVLTGAEAAEAYRARGSVGVPPGHVYVERVRPAGIPLPATGQMVPLASIRGRVVAVYWPLSRVRSL